MKPLFAPLLLVCAIGAAQTPAEPPVVSPEVLPDHRVTFRIRAPRAGHVGLWGDWMAPNEPQPMSRDESGVWSVTLGPLDPGLSIYTVNVDGVTTPDPVNPRVKLRARTSASLVSVPGDPPEWWEARDVPHGVVETVWARSEVLGDTRAYLVYTPPGYNPRHSARYPVLYLLHGSNDTAAGWTDVGKANFILDNLLAARRATPMIVVMPWGHAVPFDGPQSANTAQFERYLLTEVIPQVEGRFRVMADRDHRAIVGLSMGGGQALHIGLGHLERFGAVGAFSSAVPDKFSERFAGLLADPDSTNRRLHLLWLGCGRQDAAFDRNHALSELLAAHRINHTFCDTAGRHNFALWRRHLVQVAPLLFRTQ